MVGFEVLGNNLLIKVIEKTEETTASGLILSNAKVEVEYEIAGRGPEANLELANTASVGSKCKVKVNMCSPLELGEQKYLICPLTALLGVFTNG